ncbi:MAG TPA: dynamin family protein [Actinomycetota bacterium]|nr:dynamin family protein [Actinomycetota bacterium]
MSLQSRAILEAVEVLRVRLHDAQLSLPVAGADEARKSRDELIGQIDDHVLPRLEALGAPLVVVIGGSTGAGKSTLLNSLIGREASPSGVLRPTTTTPVLVCNRSDIEWFQDDRILPGLPRLTGAVKQGAHGLFLLRDDDIPAGLALLDAPDIDSVVASNRELASQLLAAGDLWLFVTTAARYGDAVPWEYLRKARERSTALALVLNRVPPEAAVEVPAHLGQLLETNGLDAEVLVVPETHLADGLIPDEALAPVRDWLRALGNDADARAAVVRRTLEGALASFRPRVETIALQIETQAAAAEALAGTASQSYADALQVIENGLAEGPLLRGEVLARWHEFIGTGDLMRSVQGAIGRARDRVRDTLLGRPPVEAEVRTAIEQSIQTLVVAACDKAEENTRASWRSSPPGRALLDAGFVPERSAAELHEAIDHEIRAWQSSVLELVSALGASKRLAGRVVSIGVNAVGAALMIVVFAQTGGLTGGEVAIAGGSAAVSQRLLEALFGDQAVRDLTAKARADLLARLQGIVTSQSARFETPAREAVDDVSLAVGLRSAVADVESSRSA